MPEFRIATFNANSIRARLPVILDRLAVLKPSALCIQETKVQDRDFPAETFLEAGCHCVFTGQKSYNGVAVVAYEKPELISAGLGDGEENPEQARFIHVLLNGIHIINTYVPQGFEPGSDKFNYKLRWFERLKRYFIKNFSPESPIIWTGDINVAPEPEDVYDPVRLAGSCGFHPDERAMLRDIMSWGFTDIFRKHVPGPGQFTFFDYRMPGSAAKGLGWRIDHIFATAPLAKKSTGSFIDMESRMKDKPSDHALLAASFAVD